MPDIASVWEPGDVPLVNTNGTLKTQLFIATAAQTVFILTNFTYVIATQSLQIYKNGFILVRGVDFEEVSPNTFTINVISVAGDKIYAVGFVGITGTAYLPTVGSVTVASLAPTFSLPSAMIEGVELIKGGTGFAATSLQALKDYLGIVGASQQISQESIMNVLLPRWGGEGWKNIIRSGWLPAYLNSAWGGAVAPHWLMDQATQDIIKFDSATGYIDGITNFNVADIAANSIRAQSFILPRALVNETFYIWIKIYKVGLPITGSFTARFYTDSANQPTAAPFIIGDYISLDEVTTSTDGDWARIRVVNATLSANTKYHWALTGLVDPVNYIVVKGDVAKTYPQGNLTTCNAVPVWTSTLTSALQFLIELAASKQFLQSAGAFNGRLVFNESVLTTHSQVVCNQAKNIWNGNEALWFFNLSTPQVSKPFFDIVYGLDNNRITGAVDGAGNVTFTTYDKFASVRAISTLGFSVTGNNNQIALALRSVGDGQDYMKIFINGVQNGTGLTLDTIRFDLQMQELGTAWLGGGFAAAPAWTQKLAMDVLPSADSPAWTFTGIATETNAYKSIDNRLYQNKNGYTALQNGYYSKAGLALSNATGWSVAWRAKVSAGTNTPFSLAAAVQIYDGVKRTGYMMQEYFLSFTPEGTTTNGNTGSMRNQKIENQFLATGQGSDQLLFVNGRMVRDGYSTLVTASASNQIEFGDNSIVSGESNDVVWDNLSYLNTGAFKPVVSTGLALNEFVAFSANQVSFVVALWNSGTGKSIKAVAGLGNDYIGEAKQNAYALQGITISPTNAAVTDSIIPELSTYVIGSDLDIMLEDCYTNSAAVFNILSVAIDGEINARLQRRVYVSTATATYSGVINAQEKKQFGLHKVDARGKPESSILTHYLTQRSLIVKADV